VNKTILTDKQTDYILKKSTGFWDSTIGRKHWSFSNALDAYDLSRPLHNVSPPLRRPGQAQRDPGSF
jgi:hypothetical protein